MGKRVVGVYNSEEELIQAVERYQNDGNSLRNLSVFGNTDGSMSNLGNLTGVSELGFHHGDTDSPKQKGFFDSLASAFEDRDKTGQTSYYDNLVGWGLNEGEAREYAGDLEAGRIILFEETAGTVAGFRETSTDYNETGSGYSTTESRFNDDTLDTDDERTLRLREEQLDVNKERVQTGEVQIHKDVVEEQQSINVPVSREEVYVERRAVNDVDADAGEIGDNETIRVPIVEEKVEVTKRPVVNEELVIGKKVNQSTERVVENVKREEAHIESDGDTEFDGKRNLVDDERNDKF